MVRVSELASALRSSVHYIVACGVFLSLPPWSGLTSNLWWPAHPNLDASSTFVCWAAGLSTIGFFQKDSVQGSMCSVVPRVEVDANGVGKRTLYRQILHRQR